MKTDKTNFDKKNTLRRNRPFRPILVKEDFKNAESFSKFKQYSHYYQIRLSNNAKQIKRLQEANKKLMEKLKASKRVKRKSDEEEVKMTYYRLFFEKISFRELYKPKTLTIYFISGSKYPYI